MKLTSGNAAPDFTLSASDAQEYTLASFSGQRLVLYFYPKDNTPGCTTEATDFTDLKESFAAQNAVVVGVSPDSVATHQKFVAKHNLGVLLLSDPDRVCIQAYGAWGQKNSYGNIHQGLIRSTVVIDAQGVVEKAYYNVRAKGHAERILQELRSAACLSC